MKNKLTRKEQCKIICQHLKHDGDDLDETIMIASVWDALKEIESKTNNISINNKNVDINNKNIELINDYLDLLNGKDNYIIASIKDDTFKVTDKKFNDKYYYKIDKNNHIFEGRNAYKFNSNCVNNLKECYKLYEKCNINKEFVKNKLSKINDFEKKWYFSKENKIIEDCLNIIGNYSYKLQDNNNNMFLYEITDNIYNSKFSLYLDTETNHILCKNHIDYIEHLKSAYDEDIEILNKISEFEEKYYICENKEYDDCDITIDEKILF